MRADPIQTLIEGYSAAKCQMYPGARRRSRLDSPRYTTGQPCLLSLSFYPRSPCQPSRCDAYASPGSQTALTPEPPFGATPVPAVRAPIDLDCLQTPPCCGSKNSASFRCRPPKRE